MSFSTGLKLWLPCEILLWMLSHQLEVMWTPSPRPLSLMSHFLHSWNRTGSAVLKEGLDFTLHQQWCRWGGFKEMGNDGGDSCTRTWVQVNVGLFTQGPVKIIVPHFKFSTCLRAALQPCCHCRWLVAQPPTICLQLRVTGVIGYQFAEHIGSIWL